MKKKLAVILCAVVVALCALTACGGEKSAYEGTWKIDGFAMDDITITLEDMGMTADSVVITLNSNGTADMTMDGEEYSSEWSESDTGITITDEGGTITGTIGDDGRLSLYLEGVYMYFVKA